MRDDYPDRVIGVPYGPERVRTRLREVGCAVVDDTAGRLTVTPPSWRPDLIDPNDLVEEVARLEGYERIPAVLPHAPTGRGLTSSQRLRRSVGRALAAAGFVEVLNYPFVSERDWDALRLVSGDDRRRAPRVANPLGDDQPFLRTTLLPGLLRAALRNIGRGMADVALYEIGLVFRPRAGAPDTAPRLPVDRGPTPDEVASVGAALPDQPRHVAVVLAGEWEPSGWWGVGRQASWADAVEAAREVGAAAGTTVSVRAAQVMPWHPGRCAEVRVDDTVVGHAGELHPRVVSAFGLPERSCAMEIDLTSLDTADELPVQAPTVSTYPAAVLDVALLVPADVPAAEVEDSLRTGAGELLESVRLFDVYTGVQVGPGNRSLAYTLRFRAGDRTLTVGEAGAARDAAVAEAHRRTGAVLRGTG